MSLFDRSRAGRRLRAALVAAGLAAATLALPHAVADPTVPTPTLSLPPAGIHGHAMWDSWYDLDPFGYTQQEYFVSGTAHSGASSAPYTTRMIVFRPKKASDFNGTVLLDWANVTAQFENAVDTMEARQMLMREGFAFVHVSAQSAGICCTPLTPRIWDPVRYAALNHPGDTYANDMFSQVAQSFREPGAINPLGNLDSQVILAAGQSQSASKLYNYASTTQNTAHVIDGFLIHGGGSKTFAQPLQAKVLHLLSDQEANPEGPGSDPNYRLWEVAGTAHSDFFIGYQSVFGLGPRNLADAAPQTLKQYNKTMRTAGNYGEKVHPMQATCVLAGSTMPMHYAASTAIYDLDRWVKTGTAPRNTPRFKFGAAGQALDQYGNPKGGLRLPPIDVPVATYKSTVCPLGGVTVPFDDVRLHQLYPTHYDYYVKMKQATNKAVVHGWLLRADAKDLMDRACRAKSRWSSAKPGACGYTAPAFDSA